MNYERLVQWIAGPFSVGVGVLATKAVSHLSFLGNVGLGKSSTAHAITTGVVFAAATGATALHHAKWMTNVAKWWQESGLTQPAGVSPDAPPDPSIVLPVETGTNETDKLREQLRAAGIEPTV